MHVVPFLVLVTSIRVDLFFVVFLIFVFILANKKCMSATEKRTFGAWPKLTGKLAENFCGFWKNVKMTDSDSETAVWHVFALAFEMAHFSARLVIIFSR